jgi:hypothetical protein
MESQFSSLLNRLESLVTRFEAAQGGAPVPAKTAAPAGGSSTLNNLLKEFDAQVASKIKPMEDAAAVLGADI